MLVGEPVERRPYRVVVGPTADQLGRGGPDLGADPLQVLPGQAQHVGGGQLGVQGVPELRLPQPATQPRVAALVGRRGPLGAASPRTPPARPRRRSTARLHGRATAPAPAASSIGTSSRTARRFRGTGRPPSPGGCGGSRAAPPGRCRGRPGWRRSRPATDSSRCSTGANGRATSACSSAPGLCAQRVPLVLADLGQREQRPLDQGQQLLVVDPLGRVQVVGVHTGQCAGRVAQHRHPGRDRRRRTGRAAGRRSGGHRRSAPARGRRRAARR